MTILVDLPDELTDNNVRIYVERVFSSNFQATSDSSVSTIIAERSKTLGDAKNLLGFYELVRRALEDYETRAGTSIDNRVLFTEEEPDIKSQTETITISTLKQDPGAFSSGAPFEGKVKNLRPIHREVVNDSENPGYRLAVTGYLYDNLIRFTCWARTNKSANKRTDWFLNFMEDYLWWFAAQGVSRCLFTGRSSDIVTTIDGNKWYGRPLDFFVRTESIRTFSEKTLEEISIRLSVKQE